MMNVHQGYCQVAMSYIDPCAFRYIVRIVQAWQSGGVSYITTFHISGRDFKSVLYLYSIERL